MRNTRVAPPRAPAFLGDRRANPVTGTATGTGGGSESHGSYASGHAFSFLFPVLALLLAVAAGDAAGCGGAEQVAQVDTTKSLPVDQPPPEKTLEQLYAQTAEKYYALMRGVVEHDRVAARRSAQAEISRQRVQLPRNATGLVVDRMNVVVPGASVMVTTDSADNVIGRGRTDEQGRFAVELFATSYRDLTLHVIAEGYANWVKDRIYGGIQDWIVQLDQNVDRRFLEKTAVTQKPEDRLWMLLEIVGARRFPVAIEDVFPYIGNFRIDLLRIMGTGGFQEKDDQTASPAERALELLAYWHEPADIPIIQERLPKRGYTLFKQTVIYGKSPVEVCRIWADAYFTQTEIDPRPPAKCSKPRFSPDASRALVVFAVFEPYATYRHLLAMVDYGNGWELRLVKTGK